MTAFRFIQSSDLHLGRRFVSIPQAEDGNIRGRLMEARHMSIARLADAARRHEAGHILLAGDTFDTATPSPGVVRQALTAMAEDPAVHWWVLPGNHDNLRNAEPLWDLLRRDAPANVHLLTTPAPVDLTPDAWLLPCPVPFRNPGRDLTEALVHMASPEGAIRIGLAHGGVTDFEDIGAHIPPDRDQTARLDYLALGDWHGRLSIGHRIQYSGAPEQDRFRHDRRGVCLAVTVRGAGALPEIAEVETGQFLWTDLPLSLQSGADPAAELATHLPATGRRDILIRLRVNGWASLAQRAILTHASHEAAPDFAHFELDTAELNTLHDVVDLDSIDHAGALRQAAETLMTEAQDSALSAEGRSVASEALARLYAYVTEPAS